MTSSKTEDNPGQGAATSHDSLATALMAALDEHDRHRREEAIAEAARTAAPDELIGMMGDGDSSLRRNAAMEALTRGVPRSIPALLRGTPRVSASIAALRRNELSPSPIMP